MKTNKRTFIRNLGIGTTAATVFPTIIPARVLGENAPSKKITLGFIGMGNQGVNANLNNFLNFEDAQAIAVCDAYMSRAERARGIVDQRYGTTGCKAVQDFRQIINDPAIDAVVISTPDHWHVPMSMMAMEAGKDVFSEKPTLNIQEGRLLIDSQSKNQKVFQAGIEDRSIIHFHKMVEWVKNGAIGNLEQVKVTLPAGMNHPIEQPSVVPADLDWNLWQGPSEYHDYTPSRTDMWHWRFINSYSKGAILDMGTHLVDTAQIGINDNPVCPVEVSGTGEIPEGRESNVPVKFDLQYRYSNGVEMTVKNGPKSGWDPAGCYLEFIGSKGWIRRATWNGGLEASDKQILRTKYTPENTKHWPRPPSEQRNFIDCVKSRERTTYPAIDLHHMSTTLHMGVISIQLGRKLQWDPDKEEFINDNDANLLSKSPKPRNWEKEA